MPTQTPPPIGPPPTLTQLGEATTGLQIARLGLRAVGLARRPQGNGDPVWVFPGFGAGDPSTLALRRYLLSRGYDARGWGLGRNTGDAHVLTERALERLAAFAAADGRRVHLLGWSLGGLIAREAARERPDLVTQVVTFGTPVVGGPRHTSLARWYDEGRIAEIERTIAVRDTVPIRVPLTAIHSRRDGVVHWRACLDTVTEGAENLEVGSTHLGMGIDPDVWEIVLDRLAAHPSPTIDRV
jgi:pimeloyl-ACP methyl ester carboxylesterase